MARMYKCTRCESVFSGDDWLDCDDGTKVCYGGLDDKLKYLDEAHLCPECSRQLFEWMWEIRFPKRGDGQ